MAKKEITIRLYVGQLVYDVRNKTYLTGKSRFDGTNHEQHADMMANGDMEDVDQIVRSLQTAFRSLKSKCSEYLSESGTSADNDLAIPENDYTALDSLEWTLTLRMPDNYNNATREQVAESCHNYIVDMAVGEWFVITNKPDAGEYLQKSSSDLTLLREALHKRVRPVRPVRNGMSWGSIDDDGHFVPVVVGGDADEVVGQDVQGG